MKPHSIERRSRTQKKDDGSEFENIPTVEIPSLAEQQAELLQPTYQQQVDAALAAQDPSLIPVDDIELTEEEQ